MARFPTLKGSCVTLILTLDRVILHTIMHHSSTSTYMPNFIEIQETFLDGRTYIRTYARTFETGFIKSTLSKNQPKNQFCLPNHHSLALVSVTFSALTPLVGWLEGKRTVPPWIIPSQTFPLLCSVRVRSRVRVGSVVLGLGLWFGLGGNIRDGNVQGKCPTFDWKDIWPGMCH